MSTKVFNAWRIPKEEANIHALVELSHTVAKINATDFVDEVVATLRNYPWLDDIIAKLKQIPDGMEKLPILSARAMMPAIALNSLSLCYTISNDGKALVREKLQESFKRQSMTLDDAQMASLELLLCDDLFEEVTRCGRTLSFLEGDNGSVYLKAFGLTKRAKALLDDKYERFEFYDACEMQADDFSKEVQEQIAQAATEEEKNAIISTEQSKRGKLWDDAFAGHIVWKDASLSFCVDPMKDHAEAVKCLTAIIKQLLQ